MTFGTGGYVITPIVTSYNETGRAIVLQTDGKVVVLVTPSDTTVSSNLEVIRYNSNGLLDGTFGTGGIVNVLAGGTITATSLLIQPDGKFIITANRGGLAELIRLNSGGSLDTTFGGTGYLASGIPGFTGFQTAALASNGEIFAAGGTTPGGTVEFFLARYTASGSLESYSGSPFGANYSSAEGMVFQSDGKLVVSAADGSAAALLRFTASGSLDSTFGTNGIVTFQGSSVSPPAIQADGKILVGGFYNDYHGYVERFTTAGAGRLVWNQRHCRDINWTSHQFQLF